MINNPPKGGWKPHTVYLVRVILYKSNVEHNAILHTGFIRRGVFESYCEIWCNTYNVSVNATTH